MTDARPKVALFYDVRGWAFHNVARSIARVGARDFQFQLLGRDDWFGTPEIAANAVLQSDIAVFLWRFDLLAFLETLDDAAWAKVTAPGRPAIVTIVYDHLYQSAQDLAQFGDPFNLSDAVAACSERLRAEYGEQPHLPDISHVVPDGVDLGRFSPEGRARRTGRPLRIGWVGNSAWGSTVGTDLKGMHSVFLPALARLRAAGLEMEERVADRADRQVPWAAMPDYYRNIDVLVCTSAIEGTPNPVLEAMASGVAVVTTDVGIVRQVLGPAQEEFVVHGRTPDAVAAALAQLIRDPSQVERLQKENCERRATLAWENRWPLWRDLLVEAMATASSLEGASRTELLLQFRSRRRSKLELVRRKVASSRLTYRTYETVRERWPGVIRVAKRLLAWEQT
ncbi:MAG: glycosyltransferase family 4 protein [Halioglobus sp.]